MVRKSLRCATVLMVGFVSLGCGQSESDRASAEFQFDQLRKVLESVRSRFEQGVVRTGERDAAYSNASGFVTMQIGGVVAKKVEDKAKREELKPLVEQLVKTFREQVDAKVNVPQPDFQAGLAGLDECINIVDQMEAVVGR
jgi:uncharacterized protein YlxP (DUF503 family)